MNIFKRHTNVNKSTEVNIEDFRRKYAEEQKEECIKLCPILYSNINKSMDKTCMCWAWECGYGWWEKICDLSYQIEALNIQYRKYGVMCIADQVKEKYGTLRFYYTIHTEEDMDGIDENEQIVISRSFDIEVSNLVSKTVDICYKTCERCGARIGDKYYPRCETHGWISYICDKCAVKSESIYMMNGKWYKGTKRTRNPYRSLYFKVFLRYLKITWSLIRYGR